LNYFTVSVDLTPKTYAELIYNNNSLSTPVPLLITSEDVTPVWPYDYAIIPNDTVTLKASTNDPFAPQRTYVFEIDTSHSFNSPLFRSDTVTNSGGVIMASPYGNWGTTHFNGLLQSRGGNRISAKAPVVLPNMATNLGVSASASVANANVNKPTTMQNNSMSNVPSIGKTIGSPVIAKSNTMQNPTIASSYSGIQKNISAGGTPHRTSHGPIRESF